MLAEIKQVEIEHVKIPAADAIGLDAVMAIYQALRPIMPVAGRGWRMPNSAAAY